MADRKRPDRCRELLITCWFSMALACTLPKLVASWLPAARLASLAAYMEKRLKVQNSGVTLEDDSTLQGCLGAQNCSP